FAFFAPGPPGKSAAIDVLADLYAFGATTGYLLVFISLFVLRLKDPFTPRPYKMPLNIRITYRGNRGLPMFKTPPRDWETATKRVLLEAEEFKSLEEYEAALNEHRARTGER